MRKMLLMAIALTFLAQSAAGAEPDILVGSEAAVLPTDGAVYLRAEPSDSGEALCEIPAGEKLTVLAEVNETYTRVNYQGKRGYVPSAALDYLVSLGGLSIFPVISEAERENLEHFLTAFTETDFAELSQGAFFLADASDSLLAEFAARRIATDAPDEIETGEYTGGDDARLPVSALLPVIERYFGAAPNLDSADGYIYFKAEDIHTQGGPATLTNIIDMGNGNYALYFDVSDAEAVVQTGRATIQAASLDDPGGFALSSLAINAK